jgi:uncharacterized protein
MPKSTVVRDPIHGMIELSAAEWTAVDTPVFQRLRRVRQLAMTHLVYPGARHTRFDHSIGVRHIARKLAMSIGLGHDERRVVQTAALLHDVGHGVFSHVSEQVIDELSGVEGVHESVSVAIMRTDDGLHKALGKELCERAAELVALEGGRVNKGSRAKPHRRTGRTASSDRVAPRSLILIDAPNCPLTA